RSSGDPTGASCRPDRCRGSACSGPKRTRFKRGAYVQLVDRSDRLAGELRSVAFQGGSQMRLDGRVALVTGASRGIGRCVAVELATRGVSVVIAARTLHAGSGRMAGSLQETADAVRARGGEAFPIAYDLDDVEHVGDLATEARGWKGRVDV